MLLHLRVQPVREQISVGLVSLNLDRQQVFASHLFILDLCGVQRRVLLYARLHGFASRDDLSHQAVFARSNRSESRLVLVQLCEKLRELLSHFLVFTEASIDPSKVGPLILRLLLIHLLDCSEASLERVDGLRLCLDRLSVVFDFLRFLVCCYHNLNLNYKNILNGLDY